MNVQIDVNVLTTARPECNRGMLRAQDIYPHIPRLHFVSLGTSGLRIIRAIKN